MITTISNEDLLLQQGIQLNLFNAHICHEGIVPVKDLPLIKRFLNLKNMDIKQIIEEKMKVTLW